MRFCTSSMGAHELNLFDVVIAFAGGGSTWRRSPRRSPPADGQRRRNLAFTAISVRGVHGLRLLSRRGRFARGFLRFGRFFGPLAAAVRRLTHDGISPGGLVVWRSGAVFF